MECRRNSSGTSSQDFRRCSSATKSKVYWADWEKHQKISQEAFYSCRCSTTFPLDNEKCLANARLVSLYARKFDKRQWSFIGLGSEKKWYSMKEDSPQGIWDQSSGKDVDWIRRKWMSNFPCNDQGWIQGNTKIGPVLEVTISYLHGKHGVEIRIMLLSRDNIDSWVRSTHGSNMFVMDLNNNDPEIPEDQLEEHALQLNAKDFVCRTKAKAKPQRRELADSSSRIIPMEKELDRYWTRETFSPSTRFRRKWFIFFVSHRKYIEKKMERFISGEMKENLQNPFPQSIHWSDSRWKACLAAGVGAKRTFQYCTDDSRTIVYFRAHQGHSGRNLIDPSLQDNVMIQSGFFQHIYHIGCAFNLHSIINSGVIPGGQNSSKRQTVFFLACWS